MARAFEPLTPEKRREQTRAHLLAAAADVFAKRGFHAASLDEIAEAAGFSKGAVYSNFESKEDLFLGLVHQQSQDLIGEYAEVSTEEYPTARARIDALANVYLRLNSDLTREWILAREFDLYALRDPELQHRLAEENRAAQAMVVELVKRHCDEVGVDPPLPADQIATLYIAIFAGLWQQKAIDPEGVPDDLAASAIVFIGEAIEALGTPRAKRKRT